MSVADKIKALRKQKNISQEKLERRSGVSQSSISAIERGERTPTIDTLVMIAKGLCVPVSELIEGQKEKPAASDGDGLKQEIAILLDYLPQEELSQLRDYATWLLSRRETQQAHPQSSGQPDP